ncbi:MAG: lipoate--protein ligase [Anaerolineae bacterium]|nr:lipoate--protein ligase [Anaerolineae bacterium]
MLFVDNENITDPRVNLAAEEYILRNLDPDEDHLFFFINAPSIIIGRHQNTLEEINHEYVAEHGIHVVRRLSGGGAVYHDLGNLNFSFITRYEKDDFQNFHKFTAPVIRVLRAMGVPAELSGRNDILVDGRKISGNAQYRSGERMFSHGTLLFDTKLEDVVAALNVKMTKITSKGLKSVRSRVANITEFLEEPLDVYAFRARLLEGIFAGQTPAPTYRFTEDDWMKIREIVDSRYALWEWNYGASPEFNVKKTQRFPFGELDVRVNVQRGVIQSLRIYGDYFSDREIEDLERQLVGVRYDRETLDEALVNAELSTYFNGIDHAAFLELLYG